MEVLQTNVTLFDDRKRNPQSRPIMGGVARLDDGRVVARYRISFEDGTEAYACRDYSADGGRGVLTGGATPKDWSAFMREELDRGQERYRLLEQRDFRSAAELEFADFRGRFPHTATFLRLPMPAQRSPLFEVGRVHIPRHWHDIDFRELLRQHDGGDFGIYGAYDDAPLSDEEVWTLASQPVLIANKAAINSKSGPIRSQYRLPASGRVDLLTVLSPRGPRTLIYGGDLAGHP